mmetsp:Transcript_9917/g.41622  ORF Transcript_9917/g.41622 Transcript_9917/m.41622 type:complete len:252 (+) Transcript_9917:180-935(+)
MPRGPRGGSNLLRQGLGHLHELFICGAGDEKKAESPTTPTLRRRLVFAAPGSPPRAKTPAVPPPNDVQSLRRRRRKHKSALSATPYPTRSTAGALSTSGTDPDGTTRARRIPRLNISTRSPWRRRARRDFFSPQRRRSRASPRWTRRRLRVSSSGKMARRRAPRPPPARPSRPWSTPRRSRARRRETRRRTTRRRVWKPPPPSPPLRNPPPRCGPARARTTCPRARACPRRRSAPLVSNRAPRRPSPPGRP